MEKIKLSGINLTVIKEVLDNGLEIYLLPNNNVNNFYITFNTKFGSLYTSFKEEKDNKFKTIPNGVAHFLEHLTFKMEDGVDASEFYAKLGSDANAYTTFKYTCYEVLAYNNFKENLEYLLNFVQSPHYTKKIVENEKGIICEEVKMYEDLPEDKLVFELYKALYKNENYRYQIAGTVEDVKNTTLDNIMDAYNTFYNPINMFIVITGNFNPEESIAIIKENQLKKDYKKINYIIKDTNETDNVVCSYKEIPCNVEVEKASIGIKLNKNIFNSLHLSDNELNYYLGVLLNCNFGNTSKLKEQMENGNLVMDEIQYRKEFTNTHISIIISGSSMYPHQFIDLIKDKLNNLEIDEEDLIRKKRVILSSLITNTDSIESMNYYIQSNIINYNDIINNSYDIINNLNIKICKKIINLINTDNSSTIILIKE